MVLVHGITAAKVVAGGPQSLQGPQMSGKSFFKKIFKNFSCAAAMQGFIGPTYEVGLVR